ncbi:hypothetical protein GW17_00050745, partial [Ensete ventricosum]
MRWDLVGSSLGDSSKESGSSLGTQREITGKKTGGLAARLLEVAGVYGKSSLGTRREIAGKKTGGLTARLPEVAGVCR